VRLAHRRAARSENRFDAGDFRRFEAAHNGDTIGPACA
jgi:hypothetical protein